MTVKELRKMLKSCDKNNEVRISRDTDLGREPKDLTGAIIHAYDGTVLLECER